MKKLDAPLLSLTVMMIMLALKIAVKHLLVVVTNNMMNPIVMTITLAPLILVILNLAVNMMPLFVMTITIVPLILVSLSLDVHSLL